MDTILHRNGDAVFARRVLEALPEWFGDQDAREGYIEQTAVLPMFIARHHGVACGFLSLLQHSEVHAEIYVMAVEPQVHRHGFGAQLVEAVQDFCMARNIDLLSVKTLADSVPDPHYAKTRAFYTAVGFQLFEVMPTLWGPQTPCAIYLQNVKEKWRRVAPTPP